MNLHKYLACLLLPGLLAGCAWGQTQIDLKGQARNVDFSTAPATKPFQVGTVLPGTCGVGEAFFKTDEAPGNNLYGCTAPNVWTLEAGGSGGSGASAMADLLDFKVWRDAGQPTKLTIGSCSTAKPCVYRFTDLATQVTTVPEVVVSAGTGTAHIYLSRSGGIMVGAPSGVTATCANGCTVASNVSAFPADSIPLYTWGATGGVWDAAGTDYRAPHGREVLTSGPGITLTKAGGTVNIEAATFEPTETASFWLREEFCAGDTADGAIGNLNWRRAASGTGSYSYPVGESNHPCLFQFGTGSTANNYVSLNLAASGQPLADLSASASWEAVWVFRLVETTNLRLRIGFNASSGSSTSDYFGVRAHTDVATKFQLVSFNSGSGTPVDTGVSINADWHKVRMRSTTTGEVLISFDGGSETSFTGMSAAAMSPVAFLETLTAATRSVIVDFFAMKWTVTR